MLENPVRGCHCGFKGEVEALIHSAAEVDNCVIEKGLRGRTNSTETPSEFKLRTKGSVGAG